MGAYQRQLIKRQKNFHRNYYRRFVVAAVVSMFISLLLMVAIAYVYMTYPTVRFYAVNSEVYITLLKPLDGPNLAENFLLKPDPYEEMRIRDLSIE